MTLLLTRGNTQVDHPRDDCGHTWGRVAYVANYRRERRGRGHARGWSIGKIEAALAEVD